MHGDGCIVVRYNAHAKIRYLPRREPKVNLFDLSHVVVPKLDLSIRNCARQFFNVIVLIRVLLDISRGRPMNN